MSEEKSPYMGTKVKLRAVELSDLEDMMKYWNTFETRLGLGSYFPQSKEQKEEWIKEVHIKAKEGKAYTFTILEKQTGRFLGTCALDNINAINRRASLSIAIYNPEDQNKGFGTDSVKCLLDIGFNVLNLHRIELHVYAFRELAVHVYEKLGFTKTGVRREASWIDGAYRDDLVMDILENEYRKETNSKS